MSREPRKILPHSFLLPFLLIALCLGRPRAEANPSDTAPEVRLLRAGAYLAEDVSLTTEGTWLGLFPRGEDWELMTTGVAVTAVPGDSAKHKPRCPDRRQIRADRADPPLFLVQGIGHDSPKPVRTAISTATAIRPGETLRLSTPGVLPAWVVAHGALAATKRGDVRSEYSLLITSGGRTQTFLASPDLDLELGPPTILWAGDLDRDGSFDLLLEAPDPRGGSRLSLFVSSRAKDPDGLLVLVAQFFGRSC